MTADAAERQSAFPMSTEDRVLTWADVGLLAETNSVDCACDADGARLRFSRFVQA